MAKERIKKKTILPKMPGIQVATKRIEKKRRLWFDTVVFAFWFWHTVIYLRVFCGFVCLLGNWKFRIYSTIHISATKQND